MANSRQPDLSGDGLRRYGDVPCLFMVWTEGPIQTALEEASLARSCNTEGKATRRTAVRADPHTGVAQRWPVGKALPHRTHPAALGSTLPLSLPPSSVDTMGALTAGAPASKAGPTASYLRPGGRGWPEGRDQRTTTGIK